MRGNRLSIRLRAALEIFTVVLFATSSWVAAQETVLHSFGNGTDGQLPQAGLIFNPAGNLYGTTSGGGSGCNPNGCGTVFELTPATGGGWTEQVLYSFCSQPNCTDGSTPVAGLILDAAGNLYGTTLYGGSTDCPAGCGTVFELSPTGSGGWTETVLHSFTNNGADGYGSSAGLIFDPAGNLYGTTRGGGSGCNPNGCGTVFELTPATGGGWTEHVLYSFCSQPNCTDGSTPVAGLILDAVGNLYGTTFYGGTQYDGTVFELSPGKGGGWTETVLYNFCSQTNCPDGSNPSAGLTFDAVGNLYGTTVTGGDSGVPCGNFDCGTVFELTPATGGGWTEQVLYSFGAYPDGGQPSASLILDAAGNLYGTTFYGGTSDICGGGCGTVFELAPAGGAGWTEKVLYNFNWNGNGTDAANPSAGLIFDAAGNLYGTTYAGGNLNQCSGSGCGTVFELGKLVSTSTALTTSPNPSNLGQSVTMTATVTVENGSLPTGTVVFQSNGVNIGSAPLNNSGIAVLTYGGLPVGTDSLVAMYQGSTTLGGSTSNTVSQVVMPASSMTSVTSAPNPSISGQEVTITATVSPSGPPTPTGTVGFTSNGTPISGCTAVTLSSQTAVCMTSTLAVGTDTIVATYSGDSNYVGSSGTLSQIVKVATTTALTTAPNPSNVGQAVTMTAAVTAQNGSLPTGTVVLESDGVQIGSASLNNSGIAVLNYSGLSAGTDALTATYQGSATLAGSTSNTVSQVVRPVGSTTSVTGSPNPSTFGEEVTITATVGPSGPPAPAGTVGFTSNGTPISGCTAVTLSSQTAVCTTSTLAVGTDMIVATYSGDGNYTGSSGMLSQIVNPVPSAVQFVTLTPCRVVDTRKANGTFGGPAIGGNSSRRFPLSLSGNPCSIPSSAIAYSLNVTVLPQTTLGYLTIWPSGEGQPIVSTMNSPDGRIKANAAIVPAGMPSGSVSVYVTNTTNVLLDIDGYFVTPTQGSLQFYTLTPCRIVDTRNNQDGGTLLAGMERDYTIAGQCGIPSDAAAYSFNVTVLPAAGGLDYLTVWPKGESRPTVSTLNDKTGTVVANAAIVPAGSESATAFYAHSNNTNLLLDVDGYFAAPGAGGLSLYALTPCRVLDTRQKGGSFMGEKTVNVEGSVCGPPSSAEAYIFNATVVPPGRMPYLTLWPDGEGQPVVSTLNAFDGFITSNMAIVPTSNGFIDAYADGMTQLILDISGYFAP
jgi:uncharacterized repeat protein (TIGR03803 family)